MKYRIDRFLADGVLFNPDTMEHKWAIYFHLNKILFIRSWHRKVFVIADTEQNNDFIFITSIRGTFTHGPEEPELTERILDYILRSHVLDIAHPVPLPGKFESDKNAATWCFSNFGSFAYFATHHIIKVDIPEQPLRSNSLFHISVARKNFEKIEEYISAGYPIDMLAADGTPMHWALACDGVEMLRYLIDKGAEVDARSDQGTTPLMHAVQKKDIEKTTFLIEQGADPNAVDNRGFTALHRVAEAGYIKLVKFLIEKGALPEIESHKGDTPFSLAKKRGQMKVVKLLNNYKH
jgi:ankyrin repeat protein